MLPIHQGMKTMNFLAAALLGLGLTIFAAEKTAPPHVFPTIGTIERLDPALDALLAADVQMEKLAGGFDWSEGPVWVSKYDFLLFSDVPRNVIFRWKEGQGTSDY